MTDQPNSFPPPPSAELPQLPVPGLPVVSPQASTAGPAQPWFRRRVWKLPVWGWAIVVVILVAAGVTGGTQKDEGSARADEDVVTSASIAPAVTEVPTTTERATTTTAAPTTTLAPTTTTPPQPVVLSGSGSDVVMLPSTDVMVATISHSGRSNFVVWALDAGLAQTDLLVNEIGNYNGRVPVNLRGDTTALEVDADGAWTISLLPIENAVRRVGGSITGIGSDVLFLDNTAVYAISHAGESNFVVWVYGTDNTDLAVNEIGNYSGNVPLRGPAFVVIEADGVWTISKS